MVIILLYYKTVNKTHFFVVCVCNFAKAVFQWCHVAQYIPRIFLYTNKPTVMTPPSECGAGTITDETFLVLEKLQCLLIDKL